MRKLVIGMALASTALASPTLARDGQWYVEIAGGPMLVEDIGLEVNNSGADNIDADTDTGYDFGGIVGYDFGSFRLEAEASYRAADIETLRVDSVGVPLTSTALGRSLQAPARGEANVLSFMLNGLFDFGDDDGLQGFVGGGVGVARTALDATIKASGSGAFDDSDSGLAWQALAGIRAPISDSWDVGLRYRYFNAQKVNITDTIGRGLEAKLTSHSLLGTLTYNFGGEPVAPPPPPPPPPVACNKGPYIVFFDWDRSDITPEAATILDNAVSAYRNCGTASVMLAGHADASGGKTYNQGLSERRNASVRQYLAGRGIPDGRISSQGFGESQLRVPTADGVRELQNRRVEITYGPNSGM